MEPIQTTSSALNTSFSIEFDKSNIFKLWLQMHHFSTGFDKEIEHIQILVLNTSFSIGFDEEI